MKLENVLIICKSTEGKIKAFDSNRNINKSNKEIKKYKGSKVRLSRASQKKLDTNFKEINDIKKKYSKDLKEYSRMINYEVRNYDISNGRINKLRQENYEIEDGFSYKKEDINGMKALEETFGGKIKGNKENGSEKQADYTFRGGKTELKNI